MISLFVIATIFIMIGHVYPDKIQALLKKPFLVLPESTADWWSLSHFLLFGFLAFMYPHFICELFVISVVWEIIEDALAPPHSKMLIDCDKKYSNSIQSSFQSMWCGHLAREKDYWYAKWDDVFWNSLGILVGYGLRRMISGGPF